MKIYNTLSRSKEVFVPVRPGRVGIYTCGPTVYNYAHIGNLRTYIFMDILRRVFAFNGYKVKSVMNITDVGHLLSDADDGDDKMSMAAAEQKKTPEEIAEFYSAAFFRDIARLNVRRPDVTPKATEHIGDMIKIVQALLDKGYAYETDDGIYFDISKFPDYGKLSGANLEEQLAGARVDINTGKRHPADFALWKKAAPNHIMKWPSPWGMGYPGWHIECTAMSNKYLGDVFDIHTGGIDHVPIHHENEIAQAEAWLGKKAVNYWMHSEFMLVDGGKMSKSLGNTYTVDDLAAKGYTPMEFRYMCLNVQYRQKLNFTWEAMAAAKTAYERLSALLYRHKTAPAPENRPEIEKYLGEFHEAINDDLNVPMAMGVLWKMLRLPAGKDVYDAALVMDKVFALDFDKVASPDHTAEA
ncbi:MAG TPA: cysteine--tRNA ligase, partial [Firmicutes bacterium]|nr:cysteine--tRNA ligase [Bacillota bacterium]